MKKTTLLFLTAFFLSFFLFSGKLSLFAQETDIKARTKQLTEVRKTIREKQLEKDRLALQERVFKRELKNLNDLIWQAEKKLIRISEDIKNAEKNLAAAALKHDSAFMRKHDLGNAIIAELELFNKRSFELPYEEDPAEYKIREAALRAKKEKFDLEKTTEDISASDMKKWESAKKKLLALRQQEGKVADERKGLIREKNDLLQTTAGRRAAAEQEIKNLSESAKDMQTLINKLAEASKQSKAEPVAIRKLAAEPKRKKSLPWPAEGKVILKFGRNKHPELDTYVISNGIKIKAPNSGQVKSVDSGVVAFTGNFRSYGKVVIIDHKSYFSVYGQLDDIFVTENQKVSAGALIARVGTGEESVLYFEIRQDNIPDNPLLWLKPR